MTRNAFTADQFGIVNHYDPTFALGCPETARFKGAQMQETRDHGGTLCLSESVTEDALFSLMGIIQGELTARAKSQLENA